MSKRPRYESKKDRENEERIARLVTRQWRVGYRKMPDSYIIDFAVLSKGRILGYMECKQRTNEMGAYPTIFVGQKKVEQAALNKLATGMRSIFVVQWTDRLGYVYLEDADYYTYEGRIDRGDPDDEEPMANFLINRVTVLA